MDSTPDDLADVHPDKQSTDPKICRGNVMFWRTVPRPADQMRGQGWPPQNERCQSWCQSCIPQSCRTAFRIPGESICSPCCRRSTAGDLSLNAASTSIDRPTLSTLPMAISFSPNTPICVSARSGPAIFIIQIIKHKSASVINCVKSGGSPTAAIKLQHVELLSPR